jgi:hypothetical protein
MLGVLEKDPSHPFGKTPILSSPLHWELKIYHLTFQLNTHLSATTGIPPQIPHLHKINTIEECFEDIKTAVLDFKAELRDAVSQTNYAKVDESWSINALMLDSWIEALEKRFVHHLDQMGAVPLPQSQSDVNHIMLCCTSCCEVQ